MPKTCESCGASPPTEGASLPGLLDYCATCSKDLCDTCIKAGCCGNVPALSGNAEDAEDEDLAEEDLAELDADEDLAEEDSASLDEADEEYPDSGDED